MIRMPTTIYIMGPSSTGKTTLCNALALKLGVPKEAYVTEVARQVMKETGFSRDTIGSLEMQKAIMEAHFRREEVLDENQVTACISLFDCSTDDSEAQTRKESLIAADKFKKALLEKYRSPNSVVVLLKPVKEWVQDDGVRSLEDLETCLSIFKALLDELRVQYWEFGEDEKRLEERVVRVMGFARL
ncbi:AAA domain-containing protein [Gymnopilus junonius]|uniref:AAA domain-containing protein n=1 Tax=Gymnopilus junonius TaxID=109634 RepID=A0A9P5NCR8_GYMJU|nr:AAA domain-containing protein [Gymnopilus junonius]